MENLPVVYSIVWGSCIAYLSRTDNVRAHADMKNRIRVEYICKTTLRPKGYNDGLQRTIRDWYNHTRGIYRCWVHDHNSCEFARFQFVKNRASSKRLNYVVPLYPPSPPYLQGGTHKKARRVLRHGNIDMRCTGTPNQIIPASKVQIYFRTKERKWKKMLKKKEKSPKMG